MEKEKVKELIEQYFNDGFNNVDIQFTGGTINIDDNCAFKYNEHLVIFTSNSTIYLEYKYIKEITI